MITSTNVKRLCRGLLPAIVAATLLHSTPAQAQSLPCVETNIVKYVQQPKETNGFDVWDSSSIPPGTQDGPWVLADDFVCTNTGPITDIHIWGSWYNDQYITGAITFWLGIYDDVPVSATNTYSRPGNLLWQEYFAPGQYAEELVNPSGQEQFLDPGPPVILGPEHQVWYYCFYPTNLVQTGTLTHSNIYWLAAYATLPAGTSEVYGWKTTKTVQNDVSVHEPWPGFGPPNNAAWIPTTYPLGTGGTSNLDLAFKIDTSTNQCSLTIVCPTNKTVQCGSSWIYDPPSAANPCCSTQPPTIVLQGVVTNSATQCQQVYTAYWTIIDCMNNTGTCTQQVTVVDTTPPVITCSSNQTVQCGSTWSFTQPTAVDACSGTNVTISILSTVTNGSSCQPVITRTWLATDPCGNTSTCPQTVTIVDTTPPSLTISTNITVYSCSNVVVSWSYSATDTCSSVTVTSSPPSPSTFLPNTTNTVTITAQDACGNTTNGTFTVAVICTGTMSNPPPVACVETNEIKYVQWPKLTNGFDVWNSSTAPPGTQSGDGPWVLADDFVCTNTGPITDIHIWGSWLNDQVLTNAITFWLGVYDDVPTNANNPFSHPGTNLIWQQYFAPGQYAESFYSPGEENFLDPGPPEVVGTDSQVWYYCFYPSNLTQTGTEAIPQYYWLAAFAQLPAGFSSVYGWKTTTNVQYDVSVHAPWPGFGPVNNPGWVPTDKTTAGGPLDLAFKIDTGTNIPTSTVCVETNTVKYVQEPYLDGGLDVWNSSVIPPGATDGPWLLADDFPCTNTGPITDIHIWGSWLNDHYLTNSIKFWLGIYTNVPPGPVTNYSQPGALVWQQTFLPGQYAELPYSPSQEYFVDPGPPQVLGGDSEAWYYCFYPTNLVQYGTITNPAIYWLSVFAQLPTGITNVFGWKSTTNVYFDISVHGPWPGFQPVNGWPWTPTHSPISGASVDLAFKIDTSTNASSNQCSLTIVCPTNKTVQCGSSWGFDQPTASNLCCSAAPPTITPEPVVTNSTLQCHQVYTETWLITDCMNNSGTCTQQVTVVDTTPPVITCASNQTVQCGNAWSWIPPTATDACSGTNVTVTILSTVTNSPSCPTIITRTYLATDPCGNTSTCPETVMIVDTNPPSLTISTNITVYSCSNVLVSWSFSATDTCSSVTVTSSPPSPSTFPPNTTNTVTITATDACGNTTNGMFTVAVICQTMSNPPVTCVETDSVKYVQVPNVNGGLDVWNSTVIPPGVEDGPWVLADDFVCTNTGPISDIHIWGSWLNDQALPGTITFWLGIYSNIPANVNGTNYSQPGTLLWQQYFAPGQYAESIYTNGQEYFFDPGTGNNIGADSLVWYYCFYPTNLEQTGTLAQSNIYWLSVFALVPSATNVFGWKDTTNVHNDISVHAHATVIPPVTPWIPNRMADGGQGLDLSFKISTITNRCPIGIVVPNNYIVNWCDTNPVTISSLPIISQTDACCSVTITSSPAFPAQFQPDSTNTVTVTAYDYCGNMTNTTFTVTVVRPVLSSVMITYQQTNMVVLTFPAGAILQVATNNLDAPITWVDVPGATSPYTNTVTLNPAKFYRLRCASP